MAVVRDQLFPQKPPGSRFRFSRTGVQPSPGSSTIELPSAFAESGAYPPDREVSTDRSDREGSQLAASLEGEPGPTPAGKTLRHSYPETRFRRERARDMSYFGTVSSLLQSVDSHGLWGGLTVGLPSALGSGARKRAQGRGSSEIEPRYAVRPLLPSPVCMCWK